jgi:hypothetical protein
LESEKHAGLPRGDESSRGTRNSDELVVVLARSSAFIFPALELTGLGGVVAFAHAVSKALLLGDENYTVALEGLLESSFLVEGEASHTLFKVPDLLSGQASFFGDDKRINLSEGASGASEPGS